MSGKREPTAEEFERFMAIMAKIDAVVAEHGHIDLDNDSAPNAWPLSSDETVFMVEMSALVDPEGTAERLENELDEYPELREQLENLKHRRTLN